MSRRGAGQKSETGARPAPPLVSRAEFFLTGENFELFGNVDAPVGAAGGLPERSASSGSPDVRQAVKRLAAEGLTRAAIAQRVGIAESTLYLNYFSEIGVRPGRPGRRAHAPSQASRRLVADRAAHGLALADIAAELGLSGPTLRKHYRAELSPAHNLTRKDFPHDD